MAPTANALSAKVKRIPTWAWAVGIAAVIGILYVLHKGNGSGGSTTPVLTPSGTTDTGGGGGSSGTLPDIGSLISQAVAAQSAADQATIASLLAGQVQPPSGGGGGGGTGGGGGGGTGGGGGGGTGGGSGGGSTGPTAAQIAAATRAAHILHIGHTQGYTSTAYLNLLNTHEKHVLHTSGSAGLQRYFQGVIAAGKKP